MQFKISTQIILSRNFYICASNFQLNIIGNSHMLAFLVSNSLPYFIWCRLSVEYKLVQNIKHIILIIFDSNNFEFSSDGDLIVINIVIILFWLFFSIIRVWKKYLSSNLLGSSWNFRTLKLRARNHQIVAYSPSLVSFFFVSRRRLMSNNGSDLMNALTFVLHRSSQHSFYHFSYSGSLYYQINCCL